MSICALAWWVFDVEFSITDYLFWIWVNRVDWSWLIYLQRESKSLIQVSYHTQTAFATQKRAPYDSWKNFTMFSSFILTSRIHKQWIHSQLAIQIMDSLSKRETVSGFIVKSQKGCFKVHSPIQSNILKDHSEICRCIANSQSILQIYYKFTVFIANSLWICLFRGFTIIFLSFWRIFYEFNIFPRIHYGFTIHFLNSLWIHYLFRSFTMNSIGVSRIYYEYISNISLSWIHYWFTYFFTNSLSISRICH